jgi:Tfp pilus assembly protein PilV
MLNARDNKVVVPLCDGASIMELLVSMVLVSILLLGIDAMQIRGIQQAKINFYFAVSQQQISLMAERLRLSTHHASLYLPEWNQQNQSLIPQAKSILNMSDSHYTLAVLWGSKNEQTCLQDKVGRKGCLHLSKKG